MKNGKNPNSNTIHPIAGYDNEIQLNQPLKTQVLLWNRKVYQNSFEWQDLWNTTGFSGVEVILVIDDSGSMVSNDRYNQRLTVAQNLVDNLPENSKVGVVKFTSSMYVETVVLVKSTQDIEEASTNS